MKVADFMRLAPLLPLKPSAALTVKELAQRFYGLDTGDTPSENQRRKIQRDIEELSDVQAQEDPPVRRVEGVYPPAYYLHNASMVEWFMTEQVALNLLLARQALKAAVGDEVFGAGSLEQAAGALVQESQEAHRLWSKVRTVRSGIGRQRPEIKPAVMKALLQAVTHDRQIRLEYLSSKGNRSVQDITVLGLVLKDDSVYVLAIQGLSDLPRHLPAHRIVQAEVLHKPSLVREGFNLDEYIERDYQLSHVINRESAPLPIHLQLRVRADYEYHFRERPMTTDQVFVADPDKEGWFRASATLPESFMLKQFLQSMGPGVEVLAPPELRKEISREALQAAALYRKSTE
jgi:predicted DNA-binding transcriptional regulator YafY